MTKEVKRVSFSVKQKYEINRLIIDEYTKSGLSDVKFAEFASEKLGLQISAGSIAHYRKEFEIEQNKTSPNEDAAKITGLEERVQLLEQFITEHNLEIPDVATA